MAFFSGTQYSNKDRIYEAHQGGISPMRQVYNMQRTRGGLSANRGNTGVFKGSLKFPLYSATMFVFLFSDVFVRKAYGYIDPGTGSYIFQLMIAAVVGSLFAIKLFWKKIIHFLKKISHRNVNNGSAPKE
jgi:hypothetical protein